MIQNKIHRIIAVLTVASVGIYSSSGIIVGSCEEFGDIKNCDPSIEGYEQVLNTIFIAIHEFTVVIGGITVFIGVMIYLSTMSSSKYSEQSIFMIYGGSILIIIHIGSTMVINILRYIGTGGAG